MNDNVRPSFVIDVNLSRRWIEAFASIGYDAIHWSAIGDVRTPDVDIMAWAREQSRVVFTFDLDFGRLLALTQASGPSILQTRTERALPKDILPIIQDAVAEHAVALRVGAIVIVSGSKSRVRILPL